MTSKFSVLMSLYYKEQPKYLDDCFNSLKLQTLQANEIILVLDGPICTSLEEVVEKWCDLLPLKVFKLDVNVGLGYALNFGLSKCSNELVARMDTDDICVSDRFEKQIPIILSDPSIAILGSSIKEVDASSLSFISNRTVTENHSDIMKQLPIQNPFNHMTVIYKKSIIESAGGYKHLPFMEDWYLWLRVLAAGHHGKNISDCTVVARTGLNMIQRRSGNVYIKSEWLMTKAKVKYNITSISFASLIFIKRSVPRLLPGIVLKKIYMWARR